MLNSIIKGKEPKDSIEIKGRDGRNFNDVMEIFLKDGEILKDDSSTQMDSSKGCGIFIIDNIKRQNVDVRIFQKTECGC